MSNFSLPLNLDKIKEEIQEHIPTWFYNYIIDKQREDSFGYLTISIQDESILFNILKKYLKTSIDFHLLYRWLGLDSEWAVKGDYKGISPTFFWMQYSLDHKALQIMVKLLRDYQEVYEKHNKN